jgi:hypothetical protein
MVGAGCPSQAFTVIRGQSDLQELGLGHPAVSHRSTAGTYGARLLRAVSQCFTIASRDSEAGAAWLIPTRTDFALMSKWLSSSP